VELIRTFSGYASRATFPFADRFGWRIDRWRARRLLRNQTAYDATVLQDVRTASEPYELRSGLRLHYGPVDDPAYLLVELFVHDTYGLRRWYRPRAGDNICDIGGNIGWFALACSHWSACAAHVHSFEPDPDSYNIFRQNIEANGLGHQIAVEPVAVANSVRTACLSRTHPLRRALGGEGIEVACITLPEALAHITGAIDLLKIDVEGGEIDILTDPSMLVDVRRVALEWHSLAALAQCQDTLRRAGFSSVDVRTSTDDGIGMLWATRQ
jgi:FkbM family methyltransferase